MKLSSLRQVLETPYEFATAKRVGPAVPSGPPSVRTVQIKPGTASVQKATRTSLRVLEFTRFAPLSLAHRSKTILRALVLLCLLAASLLTTPAADNQLTNEERADGWLLLFDGKSLDDWMTSDNKPSRKSPEESAINPHGSGHYMLVHKKKWSDFILSLDFKIAPKCNSGIFIRTSSLTPRPGKDVGFNGLEIAIDDTQTAGFVDTGALYDLSKPTSNPMKPAGEWNHLKVTANGPIIEIEVNGQRVNRINLSKFTEPNKRPDGTPHKFDIAYKDHPREGYIGLQDHGANCWFKNIKLKPLNASR